MAPALARQLALELTPVQFSSWLRESVKGLSLGDAYFFLNFAVNLLLLCISSAFLAQKMLKMKILTIVWVAQRPNAGQNIQQMVQNKVNPILYSLLLLYYLVLW